MPAELAELPQCGGGATLTFRAHVAEIAQRQSGIIDQSKVQQRQRDEEARDQAMHQYRKREEDGRTR